MAITPQTSAPFLQGLRTSIAVIAFGFVIEKFNLFVFTLVDAASLEDKGQSQIGKFAVPLPEGAGRAFIVVGIVAIVVATVRFVRTGRQLDDQAIHSPSIVPDLVFSVILAALLVVLSAYLIVG
jgi:putative membrane protein